MVLRYRYAPDEYRGDLDCVEIITPHTYGRCEYTGRGNDYKDEILVNGVPVAILHVMHGSSGTGKVACHELSPIGDTTLELVD